MQMAAFLGFWSTTCPRSGGRAKHSSGLCQGPPGTSWLHTASVTVHRGQQELEGREAAPPSAVDLRLLDPRGRSSLLQPPLLEAKL